jgi:hypothetical protein
MSSLQHSEMLFPLTTPFRKAVHTVHTLPTPPNSPQEPPKSLKRQPSRFRLPKLLKRIQTVDPINATVEGMTDHRYWRGQQCPKYDQPGAMTSAAVSATQQPFLTLPTVAPISLASHELLMRKTSKKLRKMPKSYRDLRACKSDNRLDSEALQPSAKAPALLPSPLPSDSEDDRDRTTLFAFRNPRKPLGAQADPSESSYEYEGIVAGYCEDVFEGKSQGPESTSIAAADRTADETTDLPPQREPQAPVSPRTTPTSNMSATLRSPQRDRSSSLSSEATWLSKSFANQDSSACVGQLERIKMNEKRLAEKSRRCCHLVQGPNDDFFASWIGGRKAVSFVRGSWFRKVSNPVLVICYTHQAWKSQRYLGSTIEFD